MGWLIFFLLLHFSKFNLIQTNKQKCIIQYVGTSHENMCTQMNHISAQLSEIFLSSRKHTYVYVRSYARITLQLCLRAET